MDLDMAKELSIQSVQHRRHRTRLLNNLGEPAKMGDLLLEGTNFEQLLTNWQLKVNTDDDNRSLVIASSHSKDKSVTLACRGNGFKLQSSSSSSLSSDEDEDDTVTDYLFKGVLPSHLLTMCQIEQAFNIAKDRTTLWQWLHINRISSSNVKNARSSAKDILKMLGIKNIHDGKKRYIHTPHTQACMLSCVCMYSVRSL
jgi:hypothetical protein